jgi:hypothetical protein
MYAGETVDFKQIKAVVESLKLKKYAIVGGQAAIYYGSPRSTVDIDIIASSETIQQALKSFNPPPSPLTVGGSTVKILGIDVDLLHYHDPEWLELLLAEAEKKEGVRLVSKPWLLVLKLSAARYVDLMDVIPVAKGMTEKEVARARQLVMQYAPSELEDFESILQFGAVE